MPTVELILAEFGADRSNAGGAEMPVARLEPSLSSFRRHFPGAIVKVFTDQPWLSVNGIEVVQVQPHFEKGGRYGWRCNDYYQAAGLLASKADIAIAVDSDLLIVSQDVQKIIPLANRFGLCMAINGRQTALCDSRSECDGGKITDEANGLGTCHATAFWAFQTGSAVHEKLLRNYCDQVVTASKNRTGARGPLALWRAEWETGIPVYTLPVQWCVTGSSLGKGDEIILHVGQHQVAEHYKELISLWMPR